MHLGDASYKCVCYADENQLEGGIVRDATCMSVAILLVHVCGVTVQ